MSGASAVTLTRVLHPCLLVRLGSVSVLFDPCFGGFARRLLTSRVAGILLPPPGIEPESLEPPAVIAISHEHEDHFDAAALSLLPSRESRVLVPTEALGKRARRLGFLRTEVLEPWESVEAPGLRITAAPARSPNSRREVSWVLEVGSVRLLHAGDTAFHSRFEEIRERLRPDVACLPVNGVSLLGLRLTMTPEEAARAAALLHARIAIPIHAEMAFTRLSRLLYSAAGTEAAFLEAASRLAPGTRVLTPRRGEPLLLDGALPPTGAAS